MGTGRASRYEPVTSADLGRMSILCRISRNRKYVFSAWQRASRVAFAASRSTLPKYASASAGSMSHNGRPNKPPQVLQVQHVRPDRAITEPGRRPGRPDRQF